jgi:hypothetical protein
MKSNVDPDVITAVGLLTEMVKFGVKLDEFVEAFECGAPDQIQYEDAKKAIDAAERELSLLLSHVVMSKALDSTDSKSPTLIQDAKRHRRQIATLIHTTTNQRSPCFAQPAISTRRFSSTMTSELKSSKSEVIGWSWGSPRRGQ